MKKNVMMRVASALLVAVLMTTCAISGTFAKYTSSDTITDNARVAKWGWGSTSVELELFKKTYGTNVQSSNEDNVIAPGTSNEYTIAWTPDANFKPEVDYTVSLTVTGTIDAGVEDKLNWTLKIGDGAVTEHATFADLLVALGTQSVDGEANAAVPTIPAITIGWTWPAGSSNADHESDTILGNEAFENLDKCSVTVALTATQK